jgi:hypothetical protein
MDHRRVVQAISLAGIVVSIVAAITMYRASSGFPGDNRGPAWCLFGFFVIEFIVFTYLSWCVSYGCPGRDEEGSKECVVRCFVWFIVMTLVALILLLFCLLATGPK